MMRINLSVIDTRYNGCILYRGKSLINGEPIVVIATGLRRKSKNSKTGKLIQTYILSDVERPTDAIQSGIDESVCGDCIHRRVDGWGTCYVNHGQGPNQVYRAYKAGSYPDFTPDMLDEHFAGSVIRLGSYGDPCAVPTNVWRMICGVALGWTGYTHGWRYCDSALKEFCMASTESVKGKRLAEKMGWKTFRVRNDDEGVLPGEFVCPASEEAGKRLSCEECLACSGGEYKGQVTPVIKSHGMFWKVARFRRMQKKLRNKKKYRQLDASVVGHGAMNGKGDGIVIKV